MGELGYVDKLGLWSVSVRRTDYTELYLLKGYAGDVPVLVGEWVELSGTSYGVPVGVLNFPEDTTVYYVYDAVLSAPIPLVCHFGKIGLEFDELSVGSESGVYTVSVKNAGWHIDSYYAGVDEFGENIFHRNEPYWGSVSPNFTGYITPSTFTYSWLTTTKLSDHSLELRLSANTTGTPREFAVTLDGIMILSESIRVIQDGK
jgi:hypothetical protein